MGRWSGLSNLIDLHFDHHGGGGGGRGGINVTTKYHKLDDSIFVFCRNCGSHSTKNDNFNKKMEGGKNRNPKHFLTWSATAANNRLQKMSKTLANNITRLQLKMEKAIPFQPSSNPSSIVETPLKSGGSKIGLGNSKCCENPDFENNNDCSSPTTESNLVSGGSSPENDANLISKMVKQLEEIGRYHYDTRIQSARIVQSHPSVSQSHSQGSVANPDKIIQINIESYKTFCSAVEEEKVTNGSGDINTHKEIKGDNDKDEGDKTLLDTQDLFYDSGTGSSNTSISGSSSKSLSIKHLWNRAPKSNSAHLNSSSPSVKRDTGSPNPMMSMSGADSSKNSSNMSAAIESTDEKCFLLEKNNNKANNQSRRNNTGSSKICNSNNSKNSSSITSTTGSSHNDNALRLKSLISQAPYPPSKLAVTIFEKEGELRHTPWFQAGIPRETALEILRNEPVGSFIVRESTTKAGCFALSLRVPKEYQPCGIAHYLIIKTSRGYKIKGFTKEFSSLTSLITHHSVMAEMLPCPLSLDQYQSQPKKTLQVSRADSSDFIEPEKLIIGTFTDF